MRFSGKVAVVTGAASGIGRAMASALAAEGAAVVAADIAPGVEETAHAIRHGGGRAEVMVGSAAEEEFVALLADQAVRSFGGLHLMFANAGISGGMAPLSDVQVSEWREVLELNLIGAFLAIREAARVMVPAGGGAIECTASVAGLRSGAGGIPYSASKAGVINMVQTAANQLAGTNVRVNAVCPGLTETGMTRFMFDAARARGSEERLGQLNPLRRAAHPDEIAAVALFLASDAASYVNGQAVAVDGGLSSSHPTVPGKFW